LQDATPTLSGIPHSGHDFLSDDIQSVGAWGLLESTSVEAFLAYRASTFKIFNHRFSITEGIGGWGLGVGDWFEDTDSRLPISYFPQSAIDNRQFPTPKPPIVIPKPPIPQTSIPQTSIPNPQPPPQKSCDQLPLGNLLHVRCSWLGTDPKQTI